METAWINGRRQCSGGWDQKRRGEAVTEPLFKSISRSIATRGAPRAVAECMSQLVGDDTTQAPTSARALPRLLPKAPIDHDRKSVNRRDEHRSVLPIADS